MCLDRSPVGDFGRPYDQNQQAPLKDPLYVPVRHITRPRSKKIKEVLNGLILTQDIPSFPKEDEGVINLIQAIDRADLA